MGLSPTLEVWDSSVGLVRPQTPMTTTSFCGVVLPRFYQLVSEHSTMSQLQMSGTGGDAAIAIYYLLYGFLFPNRFIM